ncbi:aldose epimerase family protein [Roseateles asaccharophilus]|uniref:Aldose 1-epimerase n=1 Tax=Roseateles asaccharophilus TaxID=582607 RepID=A0ABU2ADQ1_9BURK|nr:aldose epimerase family protein [Roseateles asaccharophilus]MDR7335331.1 aldose 1-epimerase [Roseateles asaccharophilus]
MSAQTFALRAADGLAIRVADIGAAWMSCRVPLLGGEREVLLGHATPEHHLTQPGYLGAIVGRYANRIANASFTLDGRPHALAANEGEHQLHGGPDGFHRRHWQVASHTDDTLELTLTSPDGDQGFPGELQVKATYRVAPPLTVHIDLEATTTAPTPVNLTSHAYFNLDGGDGPTSIRGHRLQIRGGRYLPVRPDLIPTGEQRLVKGSPFDFREPRYIGEALDLLRHAGAQPLCHDHCWLIAPAQVQAQPMARLWSGDGALGLDLHSDAPGLQFYAGEFLPRSADREGRPYAPHAGLALEPQALPDSPHHPAWPQAVLRPGEVYRHRLSYRFFPA